MSALALAILSLSIVRFAPSGPVYAPALGRDPAVQAEKLATALQDAATSWGLKPSLLVALVYHESAFNPRIRSRVGAVGLAQINPRYQIGQELARLCRDVPEHCDVWWNVWCGAKALAWYLKHCGTIAKALGAYRSGRCINGPRAQLVLATRRWVDRCVAGGTEAVCQNSTWLARRIRGKVRAKGTKPRARFGRPKSSYLVSSKL